MIPELDNGVRQSSVSCATIASVDRLIGSNILAFSAHFWSGC